MSDRAGQVKKESQILLWSLVALLVAQLIIGSMDFPGLNFVFFAILAAIGIVSVKLVLNIRRALKDPELRAALVNVDRESAAAESSAGAFGLLFGLLPGFGSFFILAFIFDQFALGMAGLVSGFIIFLIVRSGLMSGFRALQTGRSDKESRKTKRCPYCAEDVLQEAIKCKHCGEALTPN